MARQCDISGKKKRMGNRVSHANNKSSHYFKANIQTKRVFIPELKKYVRLSLSANMIRTIDKIGVMAALKKHGVSLKSIVS